MAVTIQGSVRCRAGCEAAEGELLVEVEPSDMSRGGAELVGDAAVALADWTGDDLRWV